MLHCLPEVSKLHVGPLEKYGQSFSGADNELTLTYDCCLWIITDYLPFNISVIKYCFYDSFTTGKNGF